VPIRISPCVRPICYEPVDSTHPDTQGRRHPCVACGEPATDWAYDGTDPTERYYDTGIEDAVRSILPYSRFPEFYMPMCKTCHKQRDMQELDDELEAFRKWRKSQRSDGYADDDEPPF
jgi:hypothetical protein